MNIESIITFLKQAPKGIVYLSLIVVVLYMATHILTPFYNTSISEKLSEQRIRIKELEIELAYIKHVKLFIMQTIKDTDDINEVREILKALEKTKRVYLKDKADDLLLSHRVIKNNP